MNEQERRIEEIEPWEMWADDEDPDPECSRTMSCCCEDCMQTHPERFDDEWRNYYNPNDWDHEDAPLDRLDISQVP